MTREELREEIIKIHKEQGIKYSWFTEQLNIHRNNISYFICNKREISDNMAFKLEKLVGQVNSNK